MATAICTQCGKTTPWRAQRGTRLSALRCTCGGPLKRATFREGHWVQLIQKPSANAGKRYHTCDLCQRKVLHVYTAPTNFRLRFDSTNKVHQAGTTICGLHSNYILPSDHPYWPLYDSPVTLSLLHTWIDEIEAWTAAGKPDDMLHDDWEWHRTQPTWLRGELSKASTEQDLVILRNSILDAVLRVRGISIAQPPWAI